MQEAGPLQVKDFQTIRRFLIIGIILNLISYGYSLYINHLFTIATNTTQFFQYVLPLEYIGLGLAIGSAVSYLVAGISAFGKRKQGASNFPKGFLFGSIMLMLTLIPFVMSLSMGFLDMFVMRGSSILQLQIFNSTYSLVTDLLATLFIAVGLVLVARAIVIEFGKPLLFTGFFILFGFGAFVFSEGIYSLIQIEEQSSHILNFSFTVIPENLFVTPIVQFLGFLLILLSLLVTRPIRPTSVSLKQDKGRETSFAPDDVVVEQDQSKHENF